LVAYEHNTSISIARNTSNDCCIVTETSVSTKLDPVRAEILNVVQRIGAARLSGNCHALDGREPTVDLPGKVGNILLESAEFGCRLWVRTYELTQLSNSIQEIRYRALKGRNMGHSIVDVS
jgi:hypothetical protein